MSFSLALSSVKTNSLIHSILITLDRLKKRLDFHNDYTSDTFKKNEIIQSLLKRLKSLSDRILKIEKNLDEKTKITSQRWILLLKDYKLQTQLVLLLNNLQHFDSYTASTFDISILLPLVSELSKLPTERASDIDNGSFTQHQKALLKDLPSKIKTTSQFITELTQQNMFATIYIVDINRKESSFFPIDIILLLHDLKNNIQMNDFLELFNAVPPNLLGPLANSTAVIQFETQIKQNYWTILYLSFQLLLAAGGVRINSQSLVQMKQQRVIPADLKLHFKFIMYLLGILQENPTLSSQPTAVWILKNPSTKGAPFDFDNNREAIIDNSKREVEESLSQQHDMIVSGKTLLNMDTNPTTQQQPVTQQQQELAALKIEFDRLTIDHNRLKSTSIIAPPAQSAILTQVDQIRSLTNENTQLKNAIEQQREDLKKKTQESEAYQRSFTEIQGNFTKARDELSLLKTSLSSDKAAIASALTQALNQLAELTVERNILTGQVNTSKKDLLSLDDEKRKVDDKNKQLLIENTKLTADLDLLKKQLDKLQSDNTALEKNLRDYKNENTLFVQELKQFSNTIQANEERIRELETQNDRKYIEITSLKDEISRSKLQTTTTITSIPSSTQPSSPLSTTTTASPPPPQSSVPINPPQTTQTAPQIPGSIPVGTKQLIQQVPQAFTDVMQSIKNILKTVVDDTQTISLFDLGKIFDSRKDNVSNKYLIRLQGAITASFSFETESADDPIRYDTFVRLVHIFVTFYIYYQKSLDTGKLYYDPQLKQELDIKIKSILLSNVPLNDHIKKMILTASQKRKNQSTSLASLLYSAVKSMRLTEANIASAMDTKLRLLENLTPQQSDILNAFSLFLSKLPIIMTQQELLKTDFMNATSIYQALIPVVGSSTYVFRFDEDIIEADEESNNSNTTFNTKSSSITQPQQQLPPPRLSMIESEPMHSNIASILNAINDQNAASVQVMLQKLMNDLKYNKKSYKIEHLKNLATKLKEFPVLKKNVSIQLLEFDLSNALNNN